MDKNQKKQKQDEPKNDSRRKFFLQPGGAG